MKLLQRYGVVFRKLLDRESINIPWRDLLRVYRRLEARGEIRGGRFVGGFSGEQFASPDAVHLLRSIRRTEADGSMIAISAADPLNMLGILLPGPGCRRRHRIVCCIATVFPSPYSKPKKFVSLSRWTQPMNGRRATRFCGDACRRKFALI